MSGKRLALIAFIAVFLVTLILPALYPRFFRREVVISIAGDVMLDRGVANKITQKGVSYPYEKISSLFRNDDLTIANLECSLTGSDLSLEKEVVFKADPKNAAALKSAGFDALMLSNNHAMDYYSEGLTDTLKALKGAGILYAGAGREKSGIKPCFINKNGIKIGLLSYNALQPEGTGCEGDASIAYVNEEHFDDVKSEISKAAAQCNFLIVYFHWGIEYQNEVCGYQINIAHAAIDSGASLVIGTHPHVLQGRETYEGVPIYYSIGNFIFDRQIYEDTDESLILQFTIGKNGLIKINEIPVVIENCQPQLAEGEKAVQIREKLSRYSDEVKN